MSITPWIYITLYLSQIGLVESIEQACGRVKSSQQLSHIVKFCKKREILTQFLLSDVNKIHKKLCLGCKVHTFYHLPCFLNLPYLANVSLSCTMIITKVLSQVVAQYLCSVPGVYTLLPDQTAKFSLYQGFAQ